MPRAQLQILGAPSATEAYCPAREAARAVRLALRLEHAAAMETPDQRIVRLHVEERGAHANIEWQIRAQMEQAVTRRFRA